MCYSLDMNDKPKNNSSLLEGSINKHLLRLTLPSIGGMLAITIFNLTDTFFVSRLGTDALAAMGFTFPIVMIVGALSSGMAMGAGSVIARAMGNNNHHLMDRVATDGILLSVLVVIFVSFFGVLTMDPLFRLLGAEGQTLILLKDYMFIWYLGAVAIIMPPVGDSSMRAMGDMKRPFIVMMVCAIGNMILDPIFIFGYLGFPAMGVRGASLATVISRAAGMVTTLSFLHFKYKLLNFRYENFNELLISWKRILHVGIPAAVVRVFPQFLRSVLTLLAASTGGVAAVAAIAAGTRIEGFALIVAQSLGMALIPLVGQNYGADKIDRVNLLRSFITRVAVFYGAALFLISLPISEVLAGIFSKDPEVIRYTSLYVRILFLGTIGLNLYNWTSQMLNAAGKPQWVLLINALGTAVILIPLTWLGSWLQGFTGMLVGLCLGQIILGVFSIFVGRHEFRIIPTIQSDSGQVG